MCSVCETWVFLCFQKSCIRGMVHLKQVGQHILCSFYWFWVRKLICGWAHSTIYLKTAKLVYAETLLMSVVLSLPTVIWLSICTISLNRLSAWQMHQQFVCVVNTPLSISLLWKENRKAQIVQEMYQLDKCPMQGTRSQNLGGCSAFGWFTSCDAKEMVVVVVEVQIVLYDCGGF